MNTVKLRVRPPIIVNDPATTIPKIAEWGVACHWLGDRHLCAKPQKRLKILPTTTQGDSQ